MILVRRLNGPVFALNPDLIERAESTPDTVITLGDGTKYVVAESLHELLALVLDYRARVVARAQVIDPSLDYLDPQAPAPAPRPLRGL